jgi:xylulokinase
MLLGLDIGTTAVKALLVDPENGRSHLSQANVELSFPGPDMVEQDPRAIWNTTVSAVREVVNDGNEGEIESIGISSQGGTLIPMDDGYDPVGNAIVWMDHRSRAQSSEFNEEYGIDYAFLKSGWRATGCLPLMSLLWFRDEMPSSFDKMKKFAFVGDYITRMLCGRWATDPTNAGMTMLFDLDAGTWDRDLMGMAGIEEDQLPQILPSGESLGPVSGEAMSEMGLSGNPPLVVNGGHDQYCASLGSGAIESGDMLISGGTAWVLLLTTNRRVVDTRSYLSPGRHLIDDLWGVMTSIPAGGTGMSWLERNSGYEGGGFYEKMEERAGKIAPGSDGLMFLPYFMGSTVPDWQTSIRGAVLGIGLNHRREHIFRAYMEGVGFEVLSQSQVYEGRGLDIDSVRMIGGATRSPNWPGIISDMLGLPVTIPENQEGASLGAAMMAGRGSGVFGSWREAVEVMVGKRKTIEPRLENTEKYGELMGVFRSALDGLPREGG